MSEIKRYIEDNMKDGETFDETLARLMCEKKLRSEIPGKTFEVKIREVEHVPYITYESLLALLKSFTKEQLKCSVTVYVSKEDEYYGVTRLDRHPHPNATIPVVLCLDEEEQPVCYRELKEFLEQNIHICRSKSVVFTDDDQPSQTNLLNVTDYIIYCDGDVLDDNTPVLCCGTTPPDILPRKEIKRDGR